MKKILNKKIIGMYEINPTEFQDNRGFLYKFFSSDFLKYTNGKKIIQINFSLTKKINTIRGMHYQKSPFEETKVITCIAGKIYDVVVDLRKNSKTYLQWDYVTLCSRKKNLIVIPEGCAHGFQTLENNSELIYFHTNDYSPEHEAGVRFDDPVLSIDWPKPPRNMSDRDLSFEMLKI